MTSNLVERVQLALRNPGDSPWLPGVTMELVEIGWRGLYRNAGLSLDTYGTARVIARNPGAPRTIVSHLPMFAGAKGLMDWLQVETLDAEFVRRYGKAGVRFYTAEEIDASNVLLQIREAINVMRLIPTLFTTVAALVRSVHVLDPGDDAYDVSFSEPQIPFSIFVSVPRAGSITSPMRVAEAIVHEAMHLQLTLIEQVAPLVLLNENKYFSPWKGEYRPSQSILHALYVFRVIHVFLGLLMSSPLFHGARAEYISNRYRQIAVEMPQIRLFKDSPDLTPDGFKFVRSLLADSTRNEELR